MTKNINKELETGRSMVEMLGVLAVVGVLSVGGIAGYTYAMNKHYANELLAGASERAVLVAAQLVAGKKPNLNEFANHTVPNGTFGEVKTDIADGFGITVSGVKGAVCENLKKMTDGTDVSIAKDDEKLSDVTCSGDENTFMFVFDYGVSGGTDENGGEPCGESDVEKCSGGQYYTCDDGKWVAHDLPTGTTCNGEEMECTEGATRCLNGQHQYCSGGWRDDDYSGCCFGNKAVERDFRGCIDSKYSWCSGGTWIPLSDTCCDDTVSNCSEIEICSGHGIWSGNSCICDEGWGGSACSLDPQEACNNHGTWSGYSCICDEGWGGNDCSLDSQEACNNRGIWYDTACICESGWAGSDCSLTVEEVRILCENSGHGFWYDTSCICDSGWTGSDCSTKR